MGEPIDGQPALSENPATRPVPWLLHALNISGIVGFWTVVLFAASDSVPRDPLLCVSAASIHLAAYLRWKSRDSMASAHLVLFVALMVFVAVAELLPFVENLTGIRVTRNLTLSSRLQRSVAAKLAPTVRDDTYEQYGTDPLFYRRVPGSRHWACYDYGLGPCLEAFADETGFLNPDRDGYRNVDRIKAFIAGDSVLQGTGVPSCIDLIRKRTDWDVWNLSTGGYGPRQKVDALMLFAPAKRPDWLILEFYSGNDAGEANEDEPVEEVGGPFEMRYSLEEKGEFLSLSPVYGEFFDADFHERFTFIRRVRRDCLTPALARYLADTTWSRLASISGDARQASPLLDTGRGFSIPGVVPPCYPVFPVRPDRYDLWVNKGMEITIRHYRRLLKAQQTAEPRPRLALVYNPSSYEIYQGILVAPNAEFDRRSQFQINVLSSFAKANGVVFVNMLPGFRSRMQQHPVWLYGKQDCIHWSAQGAEVAAEVLTESLQAVGLPGK